MKNDPMVLRLRWTGALAAVALLGWGVAMAGVGTEASARTLPDAGSLALPVLPPVAATDAAAQARVEAAARPLFTADRRPQPFAMASTGSAQGPSGLRLTGIVMTPEVRLATLATGEGRSLQLRLGGGPVSGWTLLDLTPTLATLQGPSGVQTLALQGKDGGAAVGEGATAAAAPAAVDGVAPAATTPRADAAASTGSRSMPAPATTMAAAPAAPQGPTSGLSLPTGSAAPAAAEQARLTRERTQSDRDQLRELRARRTDTGQTP